MQTPEAVQKHPNATFVLSTTPITTVLAWGILRLGWTMPQSVAAAMGTLVSGGLLVFRSAITNGFEMIWQNGGIVGVCRRIWKGAPPQ